MRKFCGGEDSYKTPNAILAKMKTMKRLDRAMYAIFLLVLLADVARAHAAAPAGCDASLILSAASQFQGTPSDGAILVLGRSSTSTARPKIRIATLDRFALRLSGWSRFDFSNPSYGFTPSGVSPAADVGSNLAFLAAFQSASPSQSIFGHTGSPAP
jgi:hypothetical protein